MRRSLAIAASISLLIGVFATGWWAGRVALAPPQDPLVDAAVLSYEVAAGEVSRELSATATASWSATVALVAGSGGVVTSVNAPTGALAVEGAQLLTVNLRPVVVAKGDVPAFRSLSEGVVGADVAALQLFLDRMGFAPGSTDGRFGAGTATAVRAWQRSLSMTATGVVELGDVVFTTTLPARFRPIVNKGVTVGAGEELGDLLAPAPDFRVPVTEDQATLVPPDASVTVAGPEETWAAVVAGIDLSDLEGPQLILAGVEGEPVCGGSCEAVPVVDVSSWQANIVLIPSVQGPVVPVAAVRTEPDGTTSVLTAAGESLQVEVIASNGGLAVVSGIDPGIQIQVPTADD